MDAVVHFLQPLDLHPVIDHYSVALLSVGVIIDLIASLFPLRPWMRYMALTLMILGAICAGGSYFTGDMELDRLWDSLADVAQAAAHKHALFAQYTAIAFGILAFWRILIESIGAFSGSRPVYLIVAIAAVGALFYVGHLGGQLVYTYGVGTKLYPAQQTATPAATASPAEVPTGLPTVSVPTPLPTALPPVAISPAPGAAEPVRPAAPQTPTPTATPAPDRV